MLLDLTVKTLSVTPCVPGEAADFQTRLLDQDYRKQLQDGFAVAALLGWDVFGTNSTRVATVIGVPHYTDFGGALLFQASGESKGDAFGNVPAEFETMRDPGLNPATAKVFSDMTTDQLRASIDRLKRVNYLGIEEILIDSGFERAAAREIAERIEKRRNYLLDLDLVADTSSVGHRAGSGTESAGVGGPAEMPAMRLSVAGMEPSRGAQQTVRRIDGVAVVYVEALAGWDTLAETKRELDEGGYQAVVVVPSDAEVDMKSVGPVARRLAVACPGIAVLIAAAWVAHERSIHARQRDTPETPADWWLMRPDGQLGVLSGSVLNDKVVKQARSAADRVRGQAAELFRLWDWNRRLSRWESGAGLNGLLRAALFWEGQGAQDPRKEVRARVTDNDPPQRWFTELAWVLSRRLVVIGRDVVYDEGPDSQDGDCLYIVVDGDTFHVTEPRRQPALTLTAEEFQNLIERAGELPWGEQISRRLAVMFDTGALPAGTKLPTQSDLAEFHGINPDGMAGAYADLEVSGLIRPDRHGVYEVVGREVRTSAVRLLAAATPDPNKLRGAQQEAVEELGGLRKDQSGWRLLVQLPYPGCEEAVQDVPDPDVAEIARMTAAQLRDHLGVLFTEDSWITRELVSKDPALKNPRVLNTELEKFQEVLAWPGRSDHRFFKILFAEAGRLLRVHIVVIDERGRPHGFGRWGGPTLYLVHTGSHYMPALRPDAAGIGSPMAVEQPEPQRLTVGQPERQRLTAGPLEPQQLTAEQPELADEAIDEYVEWYAADLKDGGPFEVAKKIGIGGETPTPPDPDRLRRVLALTARAHGSDKIEYFDAPRSADWLHLISVRRLVDVAGLRYGISGATLRWEHLQRLAIDVAAEQTGSPAMTGADGQAGSPTMSVELLLALVESNTDQESRVSYEDLVGFWRGWKGTWDQFAKEGDLDDLMPVVGGGADGSVIRRFGSGPDDLYRHAETDTAGLRKNETAIVLRIRGSRHVDHWFNHGAERFNLPDGSMHSLKPMQMLSLLEAVAQRQQMAGRTIVVRGRRTLSGVIPRDDAATIKKLNVFKDFFDESARLVVQIAGSMRLEIRVEAAEFRWIQGDFDDPSMPEQAIPAKPSKGASLTNHEPPDPGALREVPPWLPSGAQAQLNEVVPPGWPADDWPTMDQLQLLRRHRLRVVPPGTSGEFFRVLIARAGQTILDQLKKASPERFLARTREGGSVQDLLAQGFLDEQMVRWYLLDRFAEEYPDIYRPKEGQDAEPMTYRLNTYQAARESFHRLVREFGMPSRITVDGVVAAFCESGRWPDESDESDESDGADGKLGRKLGTVFIGLTARYLGLSLVIVDRSGQPLLRHL